MGVIPTDELDILISQQLVASEWHRDKYPQHYLTGLNQNERGKERAPYRSSN